MNPMRLFILLAFILYETQCAESFKHLKFLKSLLASKLLATEQSNFEEEIPYIVNKCELTEGGCNDGTVVELNNPSYPTNENPILIENQYTEMSSGNPEDFPVENSGNPEDFPVENSGNSEANPEKEYENVYDKDMNTEWLLGENINVNQPSDTSTLSSVTASVPDNTNHDTLKSKLQNKINAIRTKIQLISQKIKPVNEIIPNDSEVVYEENYSTTESTTSTEAKPITTKEPAIITVSSTTYTEEPINTENPIAVEPDVQVNVEAQKPIVSIIPAQNNTDLFKNQIYVSPYALWVNDCPPPPHQQVNYQPNFQYAANPLFATKQWTLANTPYTWPVYQNQQNIKFAASGPINTEGHIQWYNPYNANPVYSNPISSSVYQGNGPAALFKPTVSVSEVSSFSSTARPIYVIAQADAPMRIHANTYADKPLEFNNEPFGQLTYGNKRLSYEAKQVVNNLRVGANQATVPEQANQWINFQQVNSKPQQYAENIPSYTAETSGSVVPSAGIAYSSPSTARPIDVITPVDAPSPTYANTYADKPLEFNNAPFRQPTYDNQRLNFGTEQAVNNFKVSANQTIVPEQANQGINFQQVNSKPQQYAGNIPSYTAETSGSVVPSAGIAYSSPSTARPIDVITPVDAPSPTYANTYADKPLKFNNAPFRQPTYDNQRLNFGTEQAVNNFKVSANQTIVPEQANQGINFQQYAENIPFYTAETSGSVVPSAGIAYSSPSTARPIDVITPVDAPSPTYANTYADKPLEFNNLPFGQPTYGNQRLSYGAEQAVNNFRVGANQATVPEQANQWINFQQVNSKPQQYAENIPSYIAGPYGSMVPNAGIPYSSPSTARSNNMYSTDAPILTSANPNVAKPLPNTGYNPNYQLKYQNQKPKILTVNREVNDFKVGTNQSIIPERTNQWIYLNQANSNPLYTNPITPSISQKIRPTASIKPVVSNSGVKYFSSSTARPIDVSAPTNAPNPIPANTYTDQRMEFNTAPFKQSAYPNQRLNYGVEQVVNNFEVYTNQPIVPEQVNQRINFEQINSKSQQFPKNVQPYAVEISGSSFPSSSVTYSSSSTGQPIAVYPTDAPNPIPANTYAPKPTTVNYRPNDQPKFYYQKTNIGALSTEVNDFNVGANQPINPEQTNQRINEFEQANSKPQFPEAIISNVPVTSDQNVPSGSIIPSSSVAYSSPVEQLGPVQYPITYDTVSPAEQPNSEDNLNTYSAPVLNNAEQSSYPLRGDILFEDNSGLKDEQQDGIEYTLKQRRYAVSDYDKKPFAKKDVFKKSVSESEIRLNAAATKQTETQTPSVAKVDALVTKAELSKPSNFDNVKSDSKTEIVDVKSA